MNLIHQSPIISAYPLISIPIPQQRFQKCSEDCEVNRFRGQIDAIRSEIYAVENRTINNPDLEVFLNTLRSILEMGLSGKRRKGDDIFKLNGSIKHSSKSQQNGAKALEILDLVKTQLDISARMAILEEPKNQSLLTTMGMLQQILNTKETPLPQLDSTTLEKEKHRNGHLAVAERHFDIRSLSSTSSGGSVGAHSDALEPTDIVDVIIEWNKHNSSPTPPPPLSVSSGQQQQQQQQQQPGPIHVSGNGKGHHDTSSSLPPAVTNGEAVQSRKMNHHNHPANGHSRSNGNNNVSPHNQSPPIQDLSDDHNLSPSSITPGSKKFPCKYCCKEFGVKIHLEDHERIHTGERPFPCSVCGVAFSKKLNLDRHYKVHTGEKPFTCSICGRAFRQKSHVDKHWKTHRTNLLGSKNF